MEYLKNLNNSIDINTQYDSLEGKYKEDDIDTLENKSYSEFPQNNIFKFEDSTNYQYKDCSFPTKNKFFNDENTINDEEEKELYFINKNGLNDNIGVNKPTIESEKICKDIALNVDLTKKSTNYNTIKNEITLNNALNPIEKTTIAKKRKIINTQNMGCKKKTERITNYDINEKNGPHHKGKTDNIDIKLKRAYLKYLTHFINFIIGKIPKVKNKGKLLQLNKKIINNMKKQHILKFFDSTAKEYLSQEISEKCKRYKKDNNKTLIKYIYDINEVTLISVLEKTNRELWKIFCSEKKKEDNIFQYFDRLSDYIKNDLIKEVITDEYIKKFIYQANNFEEEFKKKQERNQK